MKITQARRYVIIGAISDVSIIYRASSSVYEVHFFIHSDYPGKLSASGTTLTDICGTLKAWPDLGQAYAYVRSLGWKQLITVSTID
jgi:hypothetical protein